MGIDPGKSGGIAVMSQGNIVYAWKTPDTERDIYSILHSVRKSICFCFIERVHSMPNQGVASSFKFGMNYGLLRGMLIALEIPFDEVTPQKWQRKLGCLSRGDKNVTKAKAQQLFPKLRITHATADALLIAKYSLETHYHETETSLSQEWEGV